MAFNPDELYRWRLANNPLAGEGKELFDASINTAGWRRVVGAFYMRTERPSREEMQVRGVNEAVQDLVKLATAADRIGKGDLLWYCWDGFERRGCMRKPCHGSTLIGFSARGARVLHAAMQSAQLIQRHGDLSLIAYCVERKEFRASYLYPAVGHYQDPWSQSSDEEGWRGGTWRPPWIQGGTQRNPDDQWERHRCLMGFTKKGLAELQSVPLPENAGEDLRWFTLTLRRAIASVSGTEPVAVPDTGAERPVALGQPQGKGKGKRGQTTQAILQLLHPEAVEQIRSLRQAERTKQQKSRAWRTRFAKYVRRVFTDDSEKAQGVRFWRLCVWTSEAHNHVACLAHD